VGSVEKADQDYDSGAGDREMLDVDDEQIELGKQICSPWKERRMRKS
jgi:hypothetical protein